MSRWQPALLSLGSQAPALDLYALSTSVRNGRKLNNMIVRTTTQAEKDQMIVKMPIQAE